MYKNLRLILVLAAALLLAAPLSPLIESRSNNPCSSCHGGRSMYLDIMEGDPAQKIPTSINESQTLNVSVVVRVNCSVSTNNVMTSIQVTLISKYGYFTVTNPTYNISSLTAGNTANASWVIRGVSGGNDTMYINATGKSTHNNLSFNDIYSPSPNITVNKAPNQLPTIRLTGPPAGSNITGGSVYKLNWTATDNDIANCKVAIFYSTDGFGTSNNSIASNLTVGVLVYNWTLPRINSTTVRLKAIITDLGDLANESMTISDFTIDSMVPAVTSVLPANGSSGVAVADALVVSFSEPMNRTSTERAFAISPAPGGLVWSWNANGTTMTGTHADFNTGTTYNCSVTGFNDSSLPGNLNYSKYSWNFTTRYLNQPSITFTAPASGAILSGDSSTKINWTATDDDLANCTVSLYYSTDNFASSNTTVATNLAANPRSFNWTVPGLNSTTMRIKGFILNQNGTGNEGLTAYFTIDSSPPAVTSVSPVNGSPGIAVTDSLIVNFSEPVDRTGAERAFSISPDPGGLGWSWNAYGTSMTGTHSDFKEGTVYNCSLTGIQDSSVPGNQNSFKYSWSFTTMIFSTPSIAFTAPASGAILSGGSSAKITWTATDDDLANCKVAFFYSTDNFASTNTTVATNLLANSRSFDWTVPGLDSTTMKIKAFILNKHGLGGVSLSSSFTIDSLPPAVTAVRPANGTSGVAVGDSLLVSFSEPVNRTSAEQAFSISPVPGGLGWSWNANGTSMTGTHSDFNAGTVYDCSVTGFLDISAPGNQNSSKFSWSFTTPYLNPPAMTFTAPASGTILSGGSSTKINWTATDDDMANCVVFLYYSTDNFASSNSTVATNLSANSGSFNWTVPGLDSPTTRIKGFILNKHGLGGVGLSADFTIDSIPPAIMAIWPANGSSDVDLTRSLVVNFSEPVEGSSAQLAFGISPDPGGVSWSWNAEQTTMTGMHNPFELGKTYTCTISGGVKDLSIPGNVFQGPYSWSFSTPEPIVSGPSIDLSSPAGGERFYWGDPAAIRWTASGGTGTLAIHFSVSENGTTGPFMPIASGIQNSGQYTINIPRLVSDKCLIEATVRDQNGRQSRSVSGIFSIAQDLSLAADLPPPGTSIRPGKSVQLDWTSAGGHGAVLVKLSFMRDSSSSSQLLFSNLPRTGSGIWTAPEVNTDSARLIINAMDDWGRSIEVSSGPLKIFSNRAPGFVSNAAIAGQVGDPYVYLVKAADEDGDGLTFSIVIGQPGMEIGSSGKVTWTPALVGNYSVVLKVSDGKGGESLQAFTINVAAKVLPAVDFITPSEGQKLKVKFNITGGASKGTKNIVMVQLRVDSGAWMDASGIASWQITLDTTKLKNGNHTLQARAFDGTDYSDPVDRRIYVDNWRPAGKNFMPMTDAWMLIALLAMVVAVSVLRRK